MISNVRSALARLGTATLEEIRAEAGCTGEETKTALDFLLRRGYARDLSLKSAETSRLRAVTAGTPSSSGALTGARPGSPASSLEANHASNPAANPASNPASNPATGAMPTACSTTVGATTCGPVACKSCPLSVACAAGPAQGAVGRPAVYSIIR